MRAGKDVVVASESDQGIFVDCRARFLAEAQLLAALGRNGGTPGIVRVATFFDIGTVGEGTTTFSGNFNDDVGIGLRLNIPHMGPLRLDYAVPITHDQWNGGSGQFQFGAGYTRQF